MFLFVQFHSQTTFTCLERGNEMQSVCEINSYTRSDKYVPATSSLQHGSQETTFIRFNKIYFCACIIFYIQTFHTFMKYKILYSRVVNKD